MSQLALLLDIGSTFTKAVVCDLNAGRIVARSQARTTAREDVMIGVRAALSHLERFDLPTNPASNGYRARYATSSAAGGLRMVCIGLTRGLTARAAREAATGAGARIYGVFSGRLDRKKLHKIADLSADIVLFTGGIDGGNEDQVLDNARVLANLPGRVPVVVGCNTKVAARVAKILSSAGLEVYLSRNVMPTLEGLDVAPAREIIRDVFMRHIVRAKGLGELSAFLDIEVMPTPYAVMKGVELLGETCDSVAVDVGGATTDVYSASWGHPTEGDLIPRGLADPRLRRTVEGDLGLREGVGSLLDLAHRRVVGAVGEAFPGFDRDSLRDAARRREEEPTYLASDPLEERLDLELGRACIDLATRRHAGVVEVEDTPTGEVRYLRGKDLRDVKALVGTGGAFVGAARRGDSRKLLETALFAGDESLRPVNPKLLVDPGYSVFAAGLLSFEHIGASRGILEELESADIVDETKTRGWERSGSWANAIT